jgi:hypothetical protein
MGIDDLRKLAANVGVTLSGGDIDLIERFAGETGSHFNLETVLADLSTAVRFSDSRYGAEAFDDAGRDQLKDARANVNRALALSCDLANNPVAQGSTLKSHKIFFSRLLTSRRTDLPRVRVFTTNYDLVIERTLGTDTR